MSGERKSALFVCLGNICRSPIAEAVFLHLLKARGVQNEWKVDSAGLGGWHSGSRPDSRARATLKNHNVEYDNKARQIESEDFDEFHYIFGMDENNISALKGDKPASSESKILLLGDFDPEGERIIRDPYYDTGAAGFEKCYEQCVRACQAFLDKVDKGEV